MKNFTLNDLMRSMLVIVLVCTFSASSFSQNTTDSRKKTNLPNLENILLWLDATAVVEDDLHNRIRWADKLDKTPLSIEGTLVENEMNGLPVVRMQGGQGIVFEPKLDNGPATIFVVFKRDHEQASGENWQRIFSAWDGEQKRDIKKPSYALYLKRGNEVVKPTIYRKSVQNGIRFHLLCQLLNLRRLVIMEKVKNFVRIKMFLTDS